LTADRTAGSAAVCKGMDCMRITSNSRAWNDNMPCNRVNCGHFARKPAHLVRGCKGRTQSFLESSIRSKTILGYVPLGWSGLIRISDPRSVWIMVHQRNRWIHSGHGFIGSFWCIMIQTVLGSLILIQITSKESTLRPGDLTSAIGRNDRLPAETVRPRLQGSGQIFARTKTCTVPSRVYTGPAELDGFLNS